MKKILIYIACLSLINVFPLFAWATEAPAKLNIDLFIKSNDVNTRADVVSYVSRELRSLGDVVLTSVLSDDAFFYKLSIVVTVLNKEDNGEGDVVLSGIIMRKFDEESTFGPSIWDSIDSIPTSHDPTKLWFLPHQFVYTGSIEDIPELSRQLVLDIDKGQLQVGREIIEQLRMYYKHMKEKGRDKYLK